MPMIQIEKCRARIDDSGAELRITIPSRKNILPLLFLAFWLFGWTFAGYFSVQEILNSLGADSQRRPDSSLYFFLMIWAVGEVIVLYILVEIIAGKEIITFTPEKLIIEHKPWVPFYPKEFMISEVKNLRVRPPNASFPQYPSKASGWPKLFFDYRMRRIGFAKDVNEAEAEQILKIIKERNFMREPSNS